MSLANTAEKYRILKKDQELEEMSEEMEQLKDQENRITISGRS